mgnify:CR=1 FL=1
MKEESSHPEIGGRYAKFALAILVVVYVFNFIENLSEIGEELGLSSEVARKLSIQTVLGASLLASSSDLDVGSLRKNVTSPGGTTEAALKVLMDGKVGWKPIIKEAILAAHVKSRKLASN